MIPWGARPGRCCGLNGSASAQTGWRGCVWYMDRNWAHSVIRECEQFPNGEYDDWVDTVTQAIIWLRKTYHLEFKDEDDDTPIQAEEEKKPIYG